MLSILETYHIHLFSSLLLLIITVLNKIKKDIPTFSIKLFYSLILVNFALLILEPISFLADATGKPYLPYLNYAVDILIIILTPVLVGLWASYIDFKLFKQQKRLNKRLFYQQVTFITIFGLLVNIFTPVFFSIDFDTNTYQRGYLFFLRYLLIFLLYIHIFYMTLKNKNRQNSYVVIGLLGFLLFPILGSIIQVFYQTLYFQFSGAALGVLIIFIFLETTSGTKDYLTNLYSRRVMDEYLDGLVERKEEFTMVMIDLDDFKEINDQYGHVAGDQVLIEFSKILVNSKKAKKMSLVARLGGDEFLCIMLGEDHLDVEGYLRTINDQIKVSQILKKYDFKGFSSGILTHNEDLDSDSLLKNVDILMYKNKNIRRQKES